VSDARLKDRRKGLLPNLISGLPVLLKDNINFANLPTTAGADALRENMADDAYITTRLKANGAIILGKTNLSEWANFLCDGCPNGYSAVGGQTLNAYGRKVFDTGGSSSGSGVAMAASYAVAAVGTETSGSILSPSSQSSLVGLKPTVGLLSRTGIVPISSTLDTPGPMTRSVTDNAIMLSAMSGKDKTDPATNFDLPEIEYWRDLGTTTLKGKRFGVIRRFLNNPLYVTAVGELVEMGADTVSYIPPEVNRDGFLSLLNADMKQDLPAYLKAHAGPKVAVTDVASVIAHNLADTTRRAPYGQARFYGIVEDKTEGEAFTDLKKRLKQNSVRYFDEPMTTNDLDAVLSINNYSAGFAAAAHYPALTVPMGYDEAGKPFGLTFIGRPFSEEKLLRLGYAFEKGTRSRKSPF
jgi:amidase